MLSRRTLELGGSSGGRDWGCGCGEELGRAVTSAMRLKIRIGRLTRGGVIIFILKTSVSVRLLY